MSQKECGCEAPPVDIRRIRMTLGPWAKHQGAVGAL